VRIFARILIRPPHGRYVLRLPPLCLVLAKVASRAGDNRSSLQRPLEKRADGSEVLRRQFRQGTTKIVGSRQLGRERGRANLRRLPLRRQHCKG